MKFIICFKPKRSDFIPTMTEDEVVIINQHFDYMKELLADNKLWLAGRREDGDFGIAILELSSLSEAIKIMTDDPAIKHGVFTGTVGAFHLALLSDNL